MVRLLLFSYPAFWIIINAAFYFLPTTCWFFSERAGEYSFSELLTLTLLVLAAYGFLRLYRQTKTALPLLFFLASVFLLLEESNYGQIFMFQSSTNYQLDAEQISVHHLFTGRLVEVVRRFFGTVLLLLFPGLTFFQTRSLKKTLMCALPLLIAFLSAKFGRVYREETSLCTPETTEEYEELFIATTLFYYTGIGILDTFWTSARQKA